jgi:hypothetical protein
LGQVSIHILYKFFNNFNFCLSNNICFIEEKTKPIKNNIYSKFLFIIAILFYGFGWSVPICCEKNFKPGIFKSLNKIVYYNKKNN